MSIGKQIREQLDVHPYKDKLRITWGFMVPVGYNNIGHLGIDVGETNRMFGDNLYAPFDGTVRDPRRWLGKDTGWEFNMVSDPIMIDGRNAVVRCGYIHTRGKSTLKAGDRVRAGDIVDISGGIFTWSSFWRGQHTHIWIMPRYKGTDAKQENWQQDHFNGSIGFIDPTTIQEDNSLDDIERIYFYMKNKGWKYYGWGGPLGKGSIRVWMTLKSLGLEKKYTPKAIQYMLYDYYRRNK